MEFVVEDGTGLANATSYASVEEAATYFANLGRSDEFDTSDADAVATAQAALNQASYECDLSYSSQYLGTKLTAAQALEFPRTEFTASDGYSRTGVPIEIKRVVFEIAAKGGSIITSPDRSDQLKRETKIAGELELTKEYFSPVSTNQPTKINKIIGPILQNGRVAGSRGNFRVERA